MTQGTTGVDKPIFWRIGGLLLSVAALIVFYKLAKIFFSQKLSLLAVFLLAFDPMYFSFARIMNLDTISLFFNLGALFLMIGFLKKHKDRNLYTAFFLLGLSLAVKLSGIFLAILLPFVMILLGDFRKRKITEVIYSISKLYLLIILGFVLGNSIYFFVNHYSVGFFTYTIDLINSQLTMAKFESGYLYSGPLSWFTIPQILTLYRLDFGKSVETVLAFQNPVLFAFSLISILWTVFLLIRKILKDSRLWILILIWFLMQYIPVFFNIHTTYYYYIIPLLPLSILMFINTVKGFEFSKNIFEVSFTVSILVFLLYYPLLIDLNVPKKYELALFKYSLYKFPEKDAIFCQNCSPRK